MNIYIYIYIQIYIYIYKYIYIYIDLFIYNVPLFSDKSAFYNKFIASFLLIKLTTQQKSEPLMLKIAISLRFTEIINKHDIYCKHLVDT